MRVEALRGEALAAAIDDVARLRISVFADWPYLYEGDLDYEARYLAPYLASDAAIVVAALDGAQIVGAATGMPIEDHDDGFAASLPDGVRPEDVFYCAESVLLPAYRGQGLGHAFFDHREAHARALGDRYASFAAVMRPNDHPMRPVGARSLAPFWKGRGYAKVPGAIAHLSWQDVGAKEETAKPLQLWLKSL